MMLDGTGWMLLNHTIGASCRRIMKRVVCGFSWKQASWKQASVSIALLTATGLPVLCPLPASANEEGGGTARVAVITSPELPSLGDPNPFLPEVDDQSFDIRLEIRLSDRRVYVYEKGQVTASFPIAVGRSGWETPTGEFEVIDMRNNPVWEHPFTGAVVPPGPDNPLGSRWIGFWTDGTNFIGFHGTPDEASVGQAASHGCIRMYDRDVVVLFDMVELGTPVSVVP